MAWLRRIRGTSRRERIRNERTREELGADETVIEKNKRKTRMFWARGEDGKKETTKCSTTWTCERRQKQKKTKEEMDGQCVRRLGRERHLIIYSIWKTKNREVWRSLPVSKLMEEKKEEEEVCLKFDL